jgi:hypothetical protein
MPLECYGGEKDRSRHWLYSAGGELLTDEPFEDRLSPKAVYWADSDTKILVNGNRLHHLRGPEIGRIEGRIIAIADIFGDWRKEIVTSVAGELRIYTSIIAASSRRVSLMQNRQYRTAVAMQAMGYFYPPHVGQHHVPMEQPASR